MCDVGWFQPQKQDTRHKRDRPTSRVVVNASGIPKDKKNNNMKDRNAQAVHSSAIYKGRGRTSAYWSPVVFQEKGLCIVGTARVLICIYLCVASVSCLGERESEPICGQTHVFQGKDVRAGGDAALVSQREWAPFSTGYNANKNTINGLKKKKNVIISQREKEIGLSSRNKIK